MPLWYRIEFILYSKNSATIWEDPLRETLDLVGAESEDIVTSTVLLAAGMGQSEG